MRIFNRVEGVLPYTEGAQGNIELSRNYHLNIKIFASSLILAKLIKTNLNMRVLVIHGQTIKAWHSFIL
ncbi:MAG: hypothetical protein LBP54_07640 [Campylobacteraceae bacterium]|jgi:hypothetical protein|nr:hypothetical protein [Campylobacteraceae bacterium]